jgi:hypothetical protein
LLTEAVTQWSGERDRWAFTQTVKEFDGDEIEQERVETYDPGRSPEARWNLISVDGRAPTDQERSDWGKRKNKKRKRDPKPLIEYFDFERARVIDEDPHETRYDLPLKGTTNWLFSVEKVQLVIAVDRSSRSVKQVDARISEPFKVALGLARVLDFDLEIHMQPIAGVAGEGEPGSTSPDGTVRAVVHKLGQRIEYYWYDFKRVTPHPGNVVAYSSR